MENLASAVIELVLFLVIGFLLGRQGILKDGFNQGLAGFLLKWSLPSLILLSMQREFSPVAALGAAGVLGLSLVMYLLSWVLGILWMRAARPGAGVGGIHRFAILFSNVGFMGFPVLEALWGREILFWAAIYNIPFHFLVFTLGIRLLTKDRGSRWWESFLNPGILATLGGFFLFLMSWKIPHVFSQPLGVLGGLTTPLSMLLIGSQLAGTSLRVTLRNPVLWGLAGVRLILVPAALAGVFLLFNLDRTYRDVSLVIAAMPAAANLVILASGYTGETQVPSQVVFLTTLGSLVTLPVVALLLKIL